MQTLTFPQFALAHSVVHVALYTRVTNGAALRKRIISAATAQGVEGERERQAVNFAFIDAHLITSFLHLQTAIYQAILADSQGALRTKTVHSEVLWALNPTNNITEALQRYGVSASTTALFVVKIGGPEEQDNVVERNMNAVVVGERTSLDELSSLTDWETIKKYYRLGDEGETLGMIDKIVVSSVAMKSVMS